MSANVHAHVVFHRTGQRLGPDLETLATTASSRPALLARHQDLTALRYDFPIVLNRADGSVHSLSGIIDAALRDMAVAGEDHDRLSRHALRLERRLRTLAAQGCRGSLSELWQLAAGQLSGRGNDDDAVAASFDRLRAVVRLDGEVVECDGLLPGRLLAHLWQRAYAAKAKRFHDRVDRLLLALSDMLRAEVAASHAGRTAPALRASIGSAHDDDFDFDAMSRILAGTTPPATMSGSRRERIQALVANLASQRFYPASNATRLVARPHEPYSFTFDRAAAALEAYRRRLPELRSLLRAIAMAELEVEGRYDDAVHDRFFSQTDASQLVHDAADSALFPDYLVRLNAGVIDAADESTLMEILTAGLPMKTLVQTDDILTVSAIGDGHFDLGSRNRRLVNMAIGLGDVFVLQSAGAHLFELAAAIEQGLAHSGAALFSVFSGASRETGLSPYLTSAAATESRAFPALRYDPAAGPDWASRFSLEGNPQVDRDWPIHPLTYEDSARRLVTEDVPFTLVDFVACDRRHTRHFAPLTRALWHDGLITVDASLTLTDNARGHRVPFVHLVDAHEMVQRALVDDAVLREAGRCRQMWRSLQELGGVHNSHAERLLSRDRSRREQPAVASDAAPAVSMPPSTDATIASAAPSASNHPTERTADDPFIETPRCTTCNECTKINSRMFAYDGNKQAYIKDPDAGTFAQLVEAAESCQVSIIHPGQPRNPNEPGLDELLARAAPFLAT